MKRLYRSTTHRVIGGVAGGLAEYFDIDPVLIRILFVVAVFAGGSGILAYVIAWIIIPEQPRENTMSTPTNPQPQGAPPPAPPPQPPKKDEKRGSVVGGMVLLVLGLLFLANNFLPDFHFEDWWPLILVAIGAGLLYKAVRPGNS
jgi:phage shock protein PspC (stress-responsive transcriptional regulator)